MAQNPKAIAVQEFAASPQRVYEAILDPAMIARFMFGPLLREEEILHIRNVPEVGGRFSYKVRRGADEIDHVGTFLELSPPSRIVFTWAIVPETAASTVSIDISAAAEGSTVTLAHELAPEWADFVDRSRAAWEKMLVVLATLL